MCTCVCGLAVWADLGYLGGGMHEGVERYEIGVGGGECLEELDTPIHLTLPPPPLSIHLSICVATSRAVIGRRDSESIAACTAVHTRGLSHGRFLELSPPAPKMSNSAVPSASWLSLRGLPGVASTADPLFPPAGPSGADSTPSPLGEVRDWRRGSRGGICKAPSSPSASLMRRERKGWQWRALRSSRRVKRRRRKSSCGGTEAGVGV